MNGNTELGSDRVASLKQELRELRAVLQAYDAVINTLPKDNLVDFANRCPEQFNKFLNAQPAS